MNLRVEFKLVSKVKLNQIYFLKSPRVNFIKSVVPLNSQFRGNAPETKNNGSEKNANTTNGF